MRVCVCLCVFVLVCVCVCVYTIIPYLRVLCTGNELREMESSEM